MKSEHPKQVSVSAILETPLGALMTQSVLNQEELQRQGSGENFESVRDRTVKKIAQEIAVSQDPEFRRRKKYLFEIISDGRFSMPGRVPGENDPACQRALEKAGLDRIPPLKGPECLDFIKSYLIEQIRQDLGLAVAATTIQPIMEVQGKTQNYIYCLAQAEGEVRLPDHVQGIGFLNSPASIPVTNELITGGTMQLYRHYIRSPLRPALANSFMSHLTIRQSLIDDWFMDIMHGYHSMSRYHKKLHGKPQLPATSPNLTIIK
jgi:hypothetical protein